MEKFHGFENSERSELEAVIAKITEAIVSDICSPYRSATEDDPNYMRKPAVDRIVRKIGEAPAELQEALLKQPEIIEAITIACIKGDRILESRTTLIPESIKSIIFADPRIKERLKK